MGGQHLLDGAFGSEAIMMVSIFHAIFLLKQFGIFPVPQGSFCVIFHRMSIFVGLHNAQ